MSGNAPGAPAIWGRTSITAHPAAAIAALPVAGPRRGLLPALWHARSVRFQLLLVFVLIDLVAILVAGSVTIVRARSQTRIEMASSMRLAELLVGDAVKFFHRQVSAEQFLAALPDQLRPMRHVRIAVKDAAGIVLAAPPSARPIAERDPAPAWFTALVAPVIKRDVVPVVVDGRTAGQVEIIGEPADEIAEVWENLVAIGTVAAVLNIAMIGILYVLFGRVLNPLAVLASGLSDLEHRSYDVRLPQLRARELAGIARQFNALASALETTNLENQWLNHRLITAQDDERRRTALELHDEVGPCLFGLKAYAASIAGATVTLSNETGLRLSECAREILAITEHLQSINRSMLDRLRPMALGHVPLNEMLGQLIRERSRQHPQIAFDFAADALARSYGDSIDLTVYRCIQESLTNVIRHAEAKHVAVETRHDTAAGLLELTVRDDGNGMSAGTPTGFGISGMRERVAALGGNHRIASNPGQGTCVRVVIPLVQPSGGGAAQHGAPA